MAGISFLKYLNLISGFWRVNDSPTKILTINDDGDVEVSNISLLPIDDSNFVKKDPSPDTEQTIKEILIFEEGKISIGNTFLQQVPSFMPSVDQKGVFIGDTPNLDRTSVFYVHDNVVLNDGGGHGISDYNTITQTGGTGISAYASTDCFPELTGTGNWNHFIGGQFRPIYTGSGNISTHFAAITASPQHYGTGTIFDLVGLRVFSPLGSGPHTNLYGIYIDNFSEGDANTYSIWTGLGRVRFGGYLRVEKDLSVGGNATIGGQTTSTGEMNAPQINLGSSNGNGVRFFNSTDSFKIYFSAATDPTYGGRFGESASDFNIYHKVTGANRGFVFVAGATPAPVATIDYQGSYWGKKGIFTDEVTVAAAVAATSAPQLQQVVTLAGAQTVTGVKDFPNSLTIPDGLSTNNPASINQLNTTNAALTSLEQRVIIRTDADVSVRTNTQLNAAYPTVPEKTFVSAPNTVGSPFIYQKVTSTVWVNFPCTFCAP